MNDQNDRSKKNIAPRPDSGSDTRYPCRLLAADSDFHHAVGVITGDRVVCIENLHQAGHCVFGPDHWIYEPMILEVRFEIDFIAVTSTGEPAVSLDVFDNVNDRILTHRAIKPTAQPINRRVLTLQSEVVPGQRLEFRVFWHGRGVISVGFVDWTNEAATSRINPTSVPKRLPPRTLDLIHSHLAPRQPDHTQENVVPDSCSSKQTSMLYSRNVFGVDTAGMDRATGFLSGNRTICTESFHDAGHCLFGPGFKTTPNTRLLISFNIEIIEPCITGQSFYDMDVYDRNSGTVLQVYHVEYGRAHQPGSQFVLVLDDQVDWILDFRVFWYGKGSISVGEVAVTEITSPMDSSKSKATGQSFSIAETMPLVSNTTHGAISDKPPALIVLVGRSGAGKSYLLESVEQNKSLKHLANSSGGIAFLSKGDIGHEHNVDQFQTATLRTDVKRSLAMHILLNELSRKALVIWDGETHFQSLEKLLISSNSGIRTCLWFALDISEKVANKRKVERNSSRTSRISSTGDSCNLEAARRGVPVFQSDPGKDTISVVHDAVQRLALQAISINDALHQMDHHLLPSVVQVLDKQKNKGSGLPGIVFVTGNSGVGKTTVMRSSKYPTGLVRQLSHDKLGYFFSDQYGDDSPDNLFPIMLEKNRSKAIVVWELTGTGGKLPPLIAQYDIRHYCIVRIHCDKDGRLERRILRNPDDMRLDQPGYERFPDGNNYINLDSSNIQKSAMEFLVAKIVLSIYEVLNQISMDSD